MQNMKIFSWVFAISGLWLILSPFLLLKDPSAFNDGFTGDAGMLMIAGVVAIFVAIYSLMTHGSMRFYIGLILAVALVVSPQFAMFTQTIANWNAAVIGVLLALVALHQIYHSEQWYSKY